MIESLTRGGRFAAQERTETQAENIDINLRHTHSVVVAINQLLQEIRAVETTRPAAGPWSSKSRDR